MRTRALNHPKQQAHIGLKTFFTKSKWSNASFDNDFLLVIAWRQRGYMQWYDDGRRNANFTFRFVKSSRRLQLRCWNTQIFLKCKRYTSVLSKTGHFESKVQLWKWTRSLSEQYQLHFYPLIFNEILEISETVLFLTLSLFLDAICDSFLHSRGCLVA